MKGIKGDRRLYGNLSPLDGLLTRNGIHYQGTRLDRDSKKPWYMYETNRGDPADLEALDKALLAAGYGHYEGWDDEPETYPQTGTNGPNQDWIQYRYWRKGRDGIVKEVIYVTTRNFKSAKGKKDITSVDHINY